MDGEEGGGWRTGRGVWRGGRLGRVGEAGGRVPLLLRIQMARVGGVVDNSSGKGKRVQSLQSSDVQPKGIYQEVPAENQG